MELQHTGVEIGASTLRRNLKKMGLVSRFAAIFSLAFQLAQLLLLLKHVTYQSQGQ